MADHAPALELQHIVQHPIFLVSVQILVLIQAMDKAKVHIIRLQAVLLPLDGGLDLFQFRRPAVLAAGIIRAEMNLQIDLFAQSLQRLAIGREDRRVAARQIKEVHSARNG